MRDKVEMIYFRQLDMAWTAYGNLIERNKELVEEIRRLNEALKGESK